MPAQETERGIALSGNGFELWQCLMFWIVTLDLPAEIFFFFFFWGGWSNRYVLVWLNGRFCQGLHHRGSKGNGPWRVNPSDTVERRPVSDQTVDSKTVNIRTRDVHWKVRLSEWEMKYALWSISFFVLFSEYSPPAATAFKAVSQAWHVPFMSFCCCCCCWY